MKIKPLIHYSLYIGEDYGDDKLGTKIRNNIKTLQREPGDICEFYWGDVKLEIDGTFKTIHMAVFIAAQSNYRYAILYHNQKTENFLDSHARFFEHIGGVYKTLVYGNMIVAVKEFIRITEKDLLVNY